MTEDPLILCLKCGSVMHRRPQITMVNWNGLPPHLESSRPKAIQDMISGADKRRAEYLEGKENAKNEN